MNSCLFSGRLLFSQTENRTETVIPNVERLRTTISPAVSSSETLFQKSTGHAEAP
jgi:hypothetical protein